MGPCYRTFTKRPKIAPRPATPTYAERNNGGAQIRRRTLEKGDYPGIMESICSKLLLCKEERWETPTCSRLQTAQQMDHKKLKRITSYTGHYRSPQWMHPLHKVRREMGV